MTGIKYDQGKPRPDLVLGDFMEALEHPVFVGTFGAYKYAPKNFHKLEGGEERYAEAGFRHYMARKKGELFDQESGELHIAHEIWDKIAELFFWLKENGHRTWEKAIRSENGMYYHPTLNHHGSPWDAEPFWFSEEDARQMIWHLAAQEKGELSIRVEVREVIEVTELERVSEALNAPNAPYLDIEIEDSFIKRHGRMKGDEYFIRSESGDFWAGKRGWVDRPEEAEVYEALVAAEKKRELEEAQANRSRGALKIDPAHLYAGG